MKDLLKRVIAVVACALALGALTGCEKAAELSLKNDKVEFPADGGNETVSFVANKAWTASSDASWCKVSPASGDASENGSVSLTLTCEANETYDGRSCTVTIRCAELSAAVKVTQAERSGLSVAQDRYEITFKAQEVRVAVSFNVDYQVEVPEWISVVSTRGLQSGAIVLSVAENATGAARTGAVTIKGGALSSEITIAQQANPTATWMNPIEAWENVLPREGGRLEIDIETNTKDYELVMPDWMMLESGSPQPANYTIGMDRDLFWNHAVIAVTANTGYETRTGEIVLHTTDGTDTDFMTIPVSQLPAPRIITVSVPALKQYLVTNYDKDGDGEINEEEALAVTKIDICTDNVEELTELAAFPSLVELYCAGSRPENYTEGDEGYGILRKLDVTGNPKLQILNCRFNRLTALDISHNPELFWMNGFRNRLTGLDVSHNPKLETMYVEYNQLSRLDVTSNPALEELWCDHNQLTELKMSSHPAMKWLYCRYNSLTDLDVAGCPKLEDLGCRNNAISRLALGDKPVLQWLSCQENKIIYLFITGCPKLQELWASKNSLTGIDLSSNPELTYIVLENMNITDIDVSRNTKLEVFSVVGNSIGSIDVTHNPLLTQLWFGYNYISSVDLSANPLLSIIHAENNRLYTLDVSRNPLLSYLRCDGNANLKELWLRTGQTIATLLYDTSVAEIKYKDVAGSPAFGAVRPAFGPVQKLECGPGRPGGDAMIVLGDQRGGMALLKTEVFQDAIDQAMEGLPK